MVVHGFDEEGKPALDEISIIGKTHAAILEDGEITLSDLYPEDFGLEMADKKQIRARDTLEENLQIAQDVLGGKNTNPTEKARMDICLANAGAIIFLGGKASDLKEGVGIAREIVEKGQAKDKLQDFIRASKA